MSDRVLTAHIPSPLARAVDKLALRLDRPKGWVVKEALARYVDLEMKRYALTAEALKEVDEGHTISDAEMGTWIRNLGVNGRRK